MTTATPPRERTRRTTGSGTGDAWRVIVLNDDHNTFEGVAFALAQTIPGIDYDRGMALANRIHTSGQAMVWSGHQELAELYHSQLEGYGLTMAPLERSSHPNAAILERAFSAFGRDPIVVARTLADDIVWRVPGSNAMSGEYAGRDAVLRFLRQTLVLSDGTYRTELRYVVADDERAVAVYGARGERAGRTLDIDQALFCVIRDGQIADVTAVPFDFDAFEAFWA